MKTILERKQSASGLHTEMDGHLFLCLNNGLIIFLVQNVIEYTKPPFKGVCQMLLCRKKMKTTLPLPFLPLCPRAFPSSISPSLLLGKEDMTIKASLTQYFQPFHNTAFSSF